MSLYDYQQSKEVDADMPFYSIIMAAMRRADDINSEKLKLLWPDIWQELHDRYHAPGGLLEGD